MRAVLSALLMAAAALGAAEAPSGSDWPHWMGPLYNGTSPETGLLRQWPKDGPAVLWRAPIQQGWSSPAVAGADAVVVMGDVSDRDDKWMETVACFDAATGAKRWEHKYPTFRCYFGWWTGGPRATPCIADRYVVTIGMMGHLHCLDRKTGQVVWKRDLIADYFKDTQDKLSRIEWKGWWFSPAVFGKVLYVSGPPFAAKPDNAPGGIYAGLDLDTGKELWVHYAKTEDGPSTGYDAFGGQAYPVTFQNEPCIMVGTNFMTRILRPADGKTVASWSLQKSGSPGSTPWLAGDRHFFGPTGHFGEFGLLDVERQPPFKVSVLWKKSFSNMWYNGVTEHRGCLYGFTGGNLEANNLAASDHHFTCLDMKTGDVKWTQKEFRLGVSHIQADGLLFIRDYQTLRLVEASPDGYVEKGRAEKIHQDGNRHASKATGCTDWTQPTLSRGRLFVRTPSELICYQVSAPGKKTPGASR